ncbi:hypothetical protein [Sphingobium yanoikuyae]|uniref:hypothetical protein n=1 Tax=Sphingobium yanoikuyae TaxID=13690 RepID=UPI0035C6CE9C
MFIEVRTDKGQLVTINLMQLEVIMTDDDGLTILYVRDGTDVPYRTKETYEALLSRLDALMPGGRGEWRAPA